ncbi:MAG: hypothetical protein R2742_00585 [Micropruina glycogenica]
MDATLLEQCATPWNGAQADSGGRTLIEVRAMGSEPALSADLATGILRMTQSALSNVVRHDATSAAVTLTWEPDRVLLDIVDDGRASIRRSHGQPVEGSVCRRCVRASGTSAELSVSSHNPAKDGDRHHPAARIGAG